MRTPLQPQSRAQSSSDGGWGVGTMTLAIIALVVGGAVLVKGITS
jgi:hypothetical protein